jgi:hypothetical protein
VTARGPQTRTLSTYVPRPKSSQRRTRRLVTWDWECVTALRDTSRKLPAGLFRSFVQDFLVGDRQMSRGGNHLRERWQTPRRRDSPFLFLTGKFACLRTATVFGSKSDHYGILLEPIPQVRAECLTASPRGLLRGSLPQSSSLPPLEHRDRRAEKRECLRNARRVLC